MIEFVICDDNKIVLSNVEKTIIKFMENKLYKIKKFNDYDNKFLTYINGIKDVIYILDIEAPSNSGIEMARLIRKNDKKSVIIFLTGYEQHGYRLLKSRLNFLTFISKYDDYESILYDTLKDALNYSFDDKIIQFKDKGIEFKLKQNKILYITKSTIDRKTIIKTDNNEYKIYKSLNDMGKIIPDFVKTHRSCLVNKSRIEQINYNKNIIIFDNGEKITLLSDKYKGGIKHG